MSNSRTLNSSMNIPNIVLRSVFKSDGNGLNLCLINAGSVHPKISEFRRIFETSKAHLVIVTETWLKSYRSNASIALEGYDVMRNDRSVRRSGGVAVYSKKGLKTKVISLSKDLKSEYVFFEVIFPNHKILVGAYYKAPDVDEIDKFEEVLSDLSPLYTDVVVLGDFNENLLSIDSVGNCKNCIRRTCSTCRFSSSLVKFGLKSIGNTPTNFDQTPSLIDLMLSNRPENFSLFNQISSGLANHDIVFATFVGPHVDFNKRALTWRNYNAINVEDLLADINNSALNEIYSCTDVNSMIDIFNGTLTTILDAHAPIIPLKVKPGINSTQHWYTHDIDKAAIERDLAKRAWKLSKSADDRKDLQFSQE